MLLSDLGERGFLAELERRGLAGPIGDDTAVLEGNRVVTLDMLVENVHFRLDWTSWRDLGYKAAAVNVSDLAAAAAEPEALLVGLGLPGTVELAQALDLYEGLNEHGIPVRGGDTVAAPGVVVSVTALGHSERVPGRAGAKPGDAVVVTGPLGAAAAGLRALERGLTGVEDLVAAHIRPPVRLLEGQRLGTIATAMVDLSDGVGVDAGHIAAESGCRLELEAERIPIAEGLTRVGDELFWAMGEDYELLATMPATAAAELGFPVVGQCAAGEGVVITRGGEPLALPGYQHFAADSSS